MDEDKSGPGPSRPLHYFTQRKRFILQSGDSCLCLFIFFPAMVAYWRGIWDFSGALINPGGEALGEWRIVGIGSLGFLGYGILPWLKKCAGERNSVRYIIVSRVFMYFHGACNMMYWRSVWLLADWYIEPGWKNDLRAIILTAFPLLISRGFRNTIFPPFYTALDTRKDLLEPFTRFGSKVSCNITTYCIIRKIIKSDS